MASCWFMCPVMVALETRRLERMVSTTIFHLPLIIPAHDSGLCMFYKFVVPQWSASRTKSRRTYILVFFIYCKIPGISPGPIQLRKGFRVGL